MKSKTRPKRVKRPECAKRERCGWDGCCEPIHGVWLVTDSFGRTYRKTACLQHGRWWEEHRVHAELVEVYV